MLCCSDIATPRVSAPSAPAKPACPSPKTETVQSRGWARSASLVSPWSGEAFGRCSPWPGDAQELGLAVPPPGFGSRKWKPSAGCHLGLGTLGHPGACLEGCPKGCPKGCLPGQSMQPSTPRVVGRWPPGLQGNPSPPPPTWPPTRGAAGPERAGRAGTGRAGSTGAVLRTGGAVVLVAGETGEAGVLPHLPPPLELGQVLPLLTARSLLSATARARVRAPVLRDSGFSAA